MKQISLFSKQARKGMRLTSFFALVITALIVVFTSAAAVGPIDFTTYTLSSYGGTQDAACGAGAAIEGGANETLHLTGNCWKQIDLSYTVTENTIMEFDFSSNVEAEIQGIGFDTDNTIDNPIQIFQVYGSQTYGSFQADNNYTAGAGTVHYTIPVGTYLTAGNYTALTFVNDDDAAPIGESVFSNVQVYEGTPPPPPMLTVDNNGAAVSAEVVSYGGATQDVGPATVSIEDSGLTLHIVGNAWKQVGIPYDVTPDTVLEFDFSSTAEGEIHAIGFDTDNTIDNPIQAFELYGTQVWGIQDFHNYTTGTIHYIIPVGTFFTGSYLSLTFANDHDVAIPTGESFFSNISIHEPVSSPTFDLWAVSGATDLPGLSDVPVWGYNTTNTSVSQPGGPTLVVMQGEEVTINLHNELGGSEVTSLLLQGQNIIPDLTGVASGGMTSYTFTATKPGTFLYEAGLTPNSQHQVAMGLYGALVVRPTGAPDQAYTGTNTAFDSEQVLVLSELDSALNTSADPSQFDMRHYHPKYYLINGKPYPNTDPISVAAGDMVLLRYVNAGLQAHSMTGLGLSQNIIAQDGHENLNSRTVVAETIASGQTLDTLVLIAGTASDGTEYPLYDASLFLRNNTGNGTYSGLGGMLTMVTVGTITPPVDTAGPVAELLNLSPNPSDGTIDVTVTATLNDTTTGNSNIAVAEFFIDYVGEAGTGYPMSSAFASPTESAAGMITMADLVELTPGNHYIYVHGQDEADNWGSFTTIVLEFQGSTGANDALHFSTAGTNADGPGGVGGDAGDVYEWDGIAYIIASNLPAGVNVDGLEYGNANDFYVSFDGEVTLPGIVDPVADEDVVHYDGATWTMFFDGSAYGLDATNVDAVSTDGTNLYFSVSDGAYGSGADIYLWDGSAVSLVLDASVMGFSDHNVDGLVYMSATDFYVSYSNTSTPVAGLGTVQDEDVIHYDGSAWSVYFDGTANGAIYSLSDTSMDADAFDIP